MPEEFVDPDEFESLPDDPFTNEEVEDLLKPEVDPAVVAHLDQEEASWEAEREEFRRMYGFDHECTCSQDYSSGNTGTVTQCFMKLTSQAMASSAEKTHELRLLTAILEQMLKINNDLVGLMENLGHEKELREYFATESDEEIDAVPESELDVPEEDFEGMEIEDDDGDDLVPA